MCRVLRLMHIKERTAMRTIIVLLMLAARVASAQTINVERMADAIKPCCPYECCPRPKVVEGFASKNNLFVVMELTNQNYRTEYGGQYASHEARNCPTSFRLKTYFLYAL